ncbi:MAG: hypothetical protein ACE5HY_06200 [Candidatus Hydrothermarchaeales archaeon]
MDERSEKTLGIVLILFGISMWEILPQRGVPFETVLLIHMSLVVPGVYLFEKPFIKYICYKIKGGK